MSAACPLEVALSDSLRVLVVDDNQDAADSLAMLLRLWGHKAEVAYGGREAIDLAESFNPQAIVLDICMNGMHGGELARHIRQESGVRGAMIIALTGHPPTDPRVVAWREYFDAILGKPQGLSQIRDLLAARCATRT
jgi:CheY-like chemotaxis protein